MNSAQPDPGGAARCSTAAVAINSPCVALSRSGPRNRAVRWKNRPCSRRHPARPARAASRPAARSLAVFGEVQHRGVLPRPAAAVLDGRANRRHELRIDARAPHRQRMADDPEHDTWNPQLQAQPTAAASVPLAIATVRGAPPMQDRLGGERCSGTSKPAAKVSRAVHRDGPAGEAEERQEERDAANAIDRPNTIWISLRKPARRVAEARRPVAMMMMTATMRATGPWMDSRMDCSGAFPGHRGAGGLAVPASNSSTQRHQAATPGGRPAMVRGWSGGKADLQKYGKHQRASWQFSRKGRGWGSRRRGAAAAVAAARKRRVSHPPVGSPRRRSRRRGRYSRRRLRPAPGDNGSPR